MDAAIFLKEHLPIDTEFFAGIVSIDIESHSHLVGSVVTIAKVRDSLRALVEGQLVNETACLMPWQGDGGHVIFDVARGCDAMLLFADRVKQLLPWLNRTRTLLTGPPVFNGAILADDSGARCARVGIVSWESEPPDGGSPYKLDEWPALCLGSGNQLQSKLIRYFESRFEEIDGLPVQGPLRRGGHRSCRQTDSPLW